MLPVYVKAFIRPPPPEILGVRLLPFSLGHSFLLDAAGNGFGTSGDGPQDLDSLLVALSICSADWESARLFCFTGISEESAKAWGERCAGEDIEEASESFRQYVLDSIAIPKRWEAGKGESCRVPWQLQTIAAILDGGAMTSNRISEAWNMPIGEAFCLVAGRQAYNGDRGIITEDELNAIEWLKENGGERGTS